MSEYIVSARKYRPMTWGSVVGQGGLTTTLRNAIANGRLAHAYLFCGPRGVGKTTSARIFAKNINCLTPTAGGDACGECESCRAFDEHRSFNIHELDAASNNSVEDIRTLIDEAQIPPQVGRYKVFIIDEVHMLSQAAFNAFLKTLEEPPAHVIFILATTEKHKILPTILSRCQVYDFNRITVEDMTAHLRMVAESEGYTAEDEALAVIAEKADGGLRDALSIFDQAAAFTNGQLTYERVTAHLGVLSTQYYFDLIDLLLEKKITDAMLLLAEILAKGFDAGLLVNGVARHLRNVMMCKEEATAHLVECSESMRQRYTQQAARCANAFLYRALKACNNCDLNYRNSRNKRLLVELTLIEIAQLDDDPVAGRPATRLKPIFAQEEARPSTAPAADADKSQPVGQQPSVVNSQPLVPIGQPITSKGNPSMGNCRPAAPAKPALKRLTALPSITQPAPVAGTSAAPQTAVGTVAPGNTTPVAQQGPPQQPAEQHQWSEKTLHLLWQQFANSLPVEELSMAQRMRATQPTFAADGNCHVTIQNPNLQPDWQRLMPRINNFMRQHSDKADVQIEIRCEEVKIRPTLTKVEMFNEMSGRNPILAKMKTAFSLDFA